MYSNNSLSVITVLVVALFLGLPLFCLSQNCSLSVSGYVIDSGIDEPMTDVHIYLEEQQVGALSDDKGYFEIKELCEGHYHLLISHIGCEPQRIYLDIHQDTLLRLELDHSSIELGSVVISAKSTPASTQNRQSINEQSISDNASQNLANMLESISGVSTLKNGSGISKPVVHGLYGNRITILNNGVAQSGQQWGNDHSPEIDPLVANKISVIKGVGSLEYQGANLGSIVTVEPKKIDKEPHLHGRGSLFLESNGLGSGLNLQVQQYNPVIAWKINGTFKRSGDKHSANYYLRNTGNQEANIALQLEKAFSEKFHTDFYFSSFNTILGVLRGAHVGNITDLEFAFTRDEPYFTEDHFIYSIDLPRQNVHHQLAKLHGKYLIDDSQILNLTLATQINSRREFDVRRGSRSKFPSMSILQLSAFAEGKYQKEFSKDLVLKTGAQLNITDNTNDPETGILPLIPDFLSYEAAIYALLNKKIDKWFFEFGGRYDYVYQYALVFSQTLPRDILRYNNHFHNTNVSSGFTYNPNHDFSLSFNAGYASRNPAINELYSNGLHQGVSGIELGEKTLRSEHSLKTTLAANGHIKEKISFETLFYFQQIQDYIFLNPQDEIEVNIRGAFPVFKYEQADAQLYGFDINTHYQISKPLGLKFTYSYIKGKDISNNLPLINIPANNLTASLAYVIPSWKKFEDIEFELTNRYVFKQTDILPEQDFTTTPDAYNLIGFQLASDIQLAQNRMRVFTKVDNLLNVAYRDYLNRQRYFADDLGINVKFGLSLTF